MSNYNQHRRQQSRDVEGETPSKTLQLIWQKAKPGSLFLDLGSGQGRDALFMARQGFRSMVYLKVI